MQRPGQETASSDGEQRQRQRQLQLFPDPVPGAAHCRCPLWSYPVMVDTRWLSSSSRLWRLWGNGGKGPRFPQLHRRPRWRPKGVSNGQDATPISTGFSRPDRGVSTRRREAGRFGEGVWNVAGFDSVMGTTGRPRRRTSGRRADDRRERRAEKATARESPAQAPSARSW